VIRIRKVSDNSLVVTNETMDEIGDGYYKYTFVNYDPTISYAIRCDVGIVEGLSARYAYPNSIDYTNEFTNITNLLEGRWRIVNDQMIFYKSDNATEIMRFNLYDENGDPASVNIFDRQRV